MDNFCADMQKAIYNKYFILLGNLWCILKEGNS